MSDQILRSSHIQVLAKAIRLPEHDTLKLVSELDPQLLGHITQHVISYAEAPTENKRLYLQGFMRA